MSQLLKSKARKVFSQSAGSLYLLIAVICAIRIGYIPGKIIVEGNAGRTFQNLIVNQPPFKWGIAETIAVLAVETILTVILYNLFFKAHKYGEFTWQLFFAIHLSAIGYIINRSKLVSKWLGTFMFIGGIGYAGNAFIRFVQIDFVYISIAFSSLLVLAVIAEFWFAFGLLIKGVSMDFINKIN